MTFDSLAGKTAQWLDGTGERSDLVISSRVRLARNLSAFPFTSRLSETSRRRVMETVAASCQSLEAHAGAGFFDAAELSGLQRQFLVERHLISPALAAGRGPRGVWVEPDEVLSLMVNEEDHLRFQAIVSGFEPSAAWAGVRAVEQALQDLSYAYREPWGYLTACPTNTGTGLRASVLIHLPALVLTQEIDGVVRGIGQMGFTVRGLYGEGTDVAGNLFQVSNQVTLGRSPEDILEMLNQVVGRLAEFEERARQTLMRDARVQVEDKVYRALAILRNARLLTSNETLNLSSAVRLGVGLQLVDDVPAGLLNALMVLTKPSHLQHRAGRTLESQERDSMRADLVRSRLLE